MMSKLKDVPTCTSIDRRIKFCDASYVVNNHKRCVNCEIRIKQEKDIKEAMAAWNRRANSDLRP